MSYSVSDCYYISIRNRLKDYMVACNTIPLLPPDQQELAKLLSERIDSFIQSRLFDKVEEVAKRDAATEHFSRTNDSHALAVKQFVLCDYKYFSQKANTQEIYSDISTLTTMQASAVVPTLTRTAEQLDLLSRCDTVQDMAQKGAVYLSGVSKLLEGLADNRNDFSLVEVEDFSVMRNFNARLKAGTREANKEVALFLAKNWGGKVTESDGTYLWNDRPVPASFMAKMNFESLPNALAEQLGIKGEELPNSEKKGCFLPRQGTIEFGGEQYHFPILVSPTSTQHFIQRMADEIVPVFKSKQKEHEDAKRQAFDSLGSSKKSKKGTGNDEH